MNINRRKQSQFELFPGSTSNSSSELGKSAPLTKDLTLSLENIIVLCIISIMVSVLFFSFGVERGKKMAMVSDSPKEIVGVIDAKNPEAARSKESKSKAVKEERVIFPVNVPEVIEIGDLDSSPTPEFKIDQEKHFTIQVASFKLQKNAQKEANKLKNIGHGDSFVVAKGSYSIVCVGKFLQKAEAKKYTSKLKSKYNDYLIRRL